MEAEYEIMQMNLKTITSLVIFYKLSIFFTSHQAHLALECIGEVHLISS